jgi:ribosomal protein S18 acetylase RimI-like enzyme
MGLRRVAQQVAGQARAGHELLFLSAFVEFSASGADFSTNAEDPRQTGAVIQVRPLSPQDLPWAEQLVGAGFGGRWQARLGSLVDALACPGLVAEREGDRVGVLTYQRADTEVEIVYFEATPIRSGVGTALLDALLELTDPTRVWLVTTNDNLDALRFYQRRGFHILEIHAGAADDARRSLKPAIPAIGEFGIPVRDEIVLERLVATH